MSAHSTTVETMHFYNSGNLCQCHSTEAIIKHAEDDGEDITSKITSPKKTLWRVVKEFFQKRRCPRGILM